MIRMMAFTFALLAAGPASALSCLRPSVTNTYAAAAESPEDYVIGTGSLALLGPSDPPEGAVAQDGDRNQMAGYTQPASFNGQLFTGNAFDRDWIVNVTIHVNCVSAWCGSANEIDSGLFFFRQVDGAYVLDEGPCPRDVFIDPTPQMLEEVVACYNSGTCEMEW
ncbi:hypothetical protein V8J82_09045 [Gymnodinialimonas sp. 2305UL16-5]|uniref:hypothetical protein n=1 Tax=Gymnodinialimonas mytili TaxID=3126503 RepID=UPI0030AA3737